MNISRMQASALAHWNVDLDGTVVMKFILFKSGKLLAQRCRGAYPDAWDLQFAWEPEHPRLVRHVENYLLRIYPWGKVTRL